MTRLLTRRLDLQLKIGRERDGPFDWMLGPVSGEVWLVAHDGNEYSPAFRAADTFEDHVLSIWIDQLAELRGTLYMTFSGTPREPVAGCGGGPFHGGLWIDLDQAAFEDAIEVPVDARAAPKGGLHCPFSTWEESQREPRITTRASDERPPRDSTDGRKNEERRDDL